MQIRKESIEALTQETFVGNCLRRLSERGEDVNSIDASTRKDIWKIAQSAAKYGISSTGSVMHFVELHWDFGLNCMDEIAAFNEIATDSRLPEHEKIERLRLTGAAILLSLAG